MRRRVLRRLTRMHLLRDERPAGESSNETPEPSALEACATLALRGAELESRDDAGTAPPDDVPPGRRSSRWSAVPPEIPVRAATMAFLAPSGLPRRAPRPGCFGRSARLRFAAMGHLLRFLGRLLTSRFRSHIAVEIERMSLRQQLAIYQRPCPGRAFLANHVACLASIDFFTVPTARNRVLKSYLAYDHGARCHMSLDGDAPEHRDVQPPAAGRVSEFPEVGGLHGS